jgi:hypothetical protein
MAEAIKEGLTVWDKNGREAVAAKEYSMEYNYSRYLNQYISLYKKLLFSTF